MKATARLYYWLVFPLYFIGLDMPDIIGLTFMFIGQLNVLILLKKIKNYNNVYIIVDK